MHPNQQPINRGAGMDAIIEKTTPYTSIQQRQEAERQRRHYRGLEPSSPPANEVFGGVVSLEKTDLMFVMMAVQTVLLLTLVVQRRG